MADGPAMPPEFAALFAAQATLDAAHETLRTRFPRGFSRAMNRLGRRWGLAKDTLYVEHDGVLRRAGWPVEDLEHFEGVVLAWDAAWDARLLVLDPALRDDAGAAVQEAIDEAELVVLTSSA